MLRSSCTGCPVGCRQRGRGRARFGRANPAARGRWRVRLSRCTDRADVAQFGWVARPSAGAGSTPAVGWGVGAGLDAPQPTAGVWQGFRGARGRGRVASVGADDRAARRRRGRGDDEVVGPLGCPRAVPRPASRRVAGRPRCRREGWGSTPRSRPRMLGAPDGVACSATVIAAIRHRRRRRSAHRAADQPARHRSGPGSRQPFDRELIARRVEIALPVAINPVASQQRLGVGAAAARNGLDVGDGAATPRHRVALPVVLDGVEKVGEAAGCLGCRDFRHQREDQKLTSASAAWSVCSHIHQ